MTTTANFPKKKLLTNAQFYKKKLGLPIKTPKLPIKNAPIYLSKTPDLPIKTPQKNGSGTLVDPLGALAQYEAACHNAAVARVAVGANLVFY
jgi:hypothetical protein